MGTKNREEAQNTRQALRRSEDSKVAAPDGYQTKDGRTVAQTGNDKAPYVWQAPFADPLQPLGEVPFGVEHNAPFVEDNVINWGTCFPAIDVADYRVLTILMQCVYATNNNSVRVQVVPFVSYNVFGENFKTQPQNRFELWSPIAFINPDPANVTRTVIAPVAQEQVFVERTMGALALNTRARVGAPANGIAHLAMDFEVSSHAKFTLSTIVLNGDVEDIQSLRFYYTRRV